MNAIHNAQYAPHSAFLAHLVQDGDFASELADWYDEKLQSEAGGAAAGE